MKKKEILYPVSPTGDLYNFSYGPEGENSERYIWVKNEIRYRTIKITGLERGRSAAHFKAIDAKTGEQFTIFMVDLLNIILTGAIVKGEVTGNFEYCKRGSNYGIHLAEVK